MDRIDISEEVGLRFSHIFKNIGDSFDTVAEYIRYRFERTWSEFVRTLRRTGKYLSMAILYGTNSKEYRSAVRAYRRSQRNNQTIKRYKHGRTQKTRVKR